MALGTHTDVLTLCPRRRASAWCAAMNRRLICRALAVSAAAMGSSVIARSRRIGAALLATMHAADLDELRQKPLWPLLRDSGVFSRAVIIEGTGEERRYRVEELLP